MRQVDNLSYQIAYATYLGGNTSSSNFPATPNALQTRHNGKGDAFIVKLIPLGK